MSMFADTYLDQSLSFASKVQKQYGEKIGRADKGVKRASLWVLWRTYMPSLLTEIGYLTNREEEFFLGSTKGQEYIASGLFRAFREYKDEIEGSVKKYDDAFEKQEPYKMGKDDSLEIEKSRLANVPAKPEAAIAEAKDEDDSDEGEKKVETPIVNTEASNTSVSESKKMPVIYKVQLLSSDKKLAFTSEQLKNAENPGEYIENGVYKYTSGKFWSFSDANQHKTKLRKIGYKDAFVIATQDGKRVPIK
jgi:N-acetylmuramoyl-L-alanine amidase